MVYTPALVKSVAAFIAVNLFFVALNALGAAILFGLFRLGQQLTPELMEQPFFVYPLGLVGIGATIWCAIKAVQIIGRRLSRGPARGRV
jgi:hypothetical protein